VAPDQATAEDPDATGEERTLLYGQHDHVRYYGRDFEDRLLAAGLGFTRVTPRGMLGVHLCGYFALVPDECVWVVRRDDANGHDVRPRSLRLRTLPYVYDRLVEAETELAQLRGQWPVRTSLRVRGWSARARRKLLARR